MSRTSVLAIFEDGIFKPLEKVRLPNHKKIQLVILPADDRLAELVKTQKQALKKYCGIGKSGMSDVSRNHDNYLYGKN